MVFDGSRRSFQLRRQASSLLPRHHVSKRSNIEACAEKSEEGLVDSEAILVLLI